VGAWAHGIGRLDRLQPDHCAHDSKVSNDNSAPQPTIAAARRGAQTLEGVAHYEHREHEAKASKAMGSLEVRAATVAAHAGTLKRARAAGARRP